MSRLQNLINGSSGVTPTGSRLNNLIQAQATPLNSAAYSGERGSQNNGGFIGGVGYLGEKLAVGFMSSVEGI